MIRSQQLFSISRRSARNLSYLKLTEEFPTSVKVQPSTPHAPVEKSSTLNNGIKISSRDSHAPVANITFSLSSGSGFESYTAKGSAHLLGTAAFTGTTKRSSLALVRELETLGAKFSTSVDREKLSYHVRVLSENVNKAFALVAEAITSPAPQPYVIEESKSTAQYCYDWLSGKPVEQVKELLHETAFGEESSLGAPLLADNLCAVDANTVQEFRRNQFKSGNLVIEASGVSHDALTTLASELFQSLPQGATPFPGAAYVGGSKKVKVDLAGASVAGLAFPVPPKAESQSYAVLFNLLEKQSNGAFVPFYKQYESSGLIGFTVQGDVSTLTDSLKSGIAAIKAVASGKASIDASVKKVAVDNAVLRDSGVISSNTINNVSAAGVSAAANKVLGSKPSFVVLGRTSGSPCYNTVSELLK